MRRATTALAFLVAAVISVVLLVWRDVDFFDALLGTVAFILAMELARRVRTRSIRNNQRSAWE